MRDSNLNVEEYNRYQKISDLIDGYVVASDDPYQDKRVRDVKRKCFNSNVSYQDIEFAISVFFLATLFNSEG